MAESRKKPGGGKGKRPGAGSPPPPTPPSTQPPSKAVNPGDIPPGDARPGYYWVKDGNGKWVEVAADSGGPADPGGGAPGDPPYPAPEGFMWQLAPDGKTWMLAQVPAAATPTPPPAPGMSEKERAGAKQRLKELMLSYGLISQQDFDNNTGMWKTVNDLVAEWGGNNDSVIMSYLRDSDPYKARFKGNAERIKQGYSAMSEAEYIAVEDQIKKTMRGFGLDDAFYSNERLASLIGFDVSGDEVTDRLTKAKRIVDSADSNIKNSLVNLYGASLGDLVGYVLDPKLAAEGLQRKINAGIAFGVAQGSGLELDRSLSEQIGELTYGDERTARQSLGQAGELAKSVRRLQTLESDINLTDADVVEQQFGLDAQAGRKVKTLQSRERARFSGSSGAFAGTLNSSSY